MAHIKWTDEYSVGVELIDEQHKHFFGLLDEMFEAISSLDTGHKIGGVIAKLVAHTANHFATEEKYFEEFNYEYTEDHKERHRDLAATVADFESRYHEGDVEMASEMVEFLEGWIIGHIMETDKKYVDCFHEHGLC
ncbi:MAG: hypothetical protein ACD_81C00194G0002 [uncultured bacterium]|uniref:Hemerythrin-like protein metal-binding protein n=1 Tax=Candidatus Wolfebacteria bacterium GW2011_GWE2_44_13 TaxID=1619017 RepID=A0A0G1HBL5_9BACT|nr:MAG: hypothetical protein ACD_81C00194G0002 [uncultured bacterium]KKT43918.1 MAG: Hemerythrin-like protein metal-binding protein [Candidatus Wolfebacteria bacterium GW2011_GWE2_44_13]